MKVVQINAVCDFGSTGVICWELNEALIHFGHEGIIIYGNGKSEYLFSHKVARKYGMKIHGLFYRNFEKKQT